MDSKIIKCHSCNAILKKNTLKCPNCGTNLEIEDIKKTKFLNEIEALLTNKEFESAKHLNERYSKYYKNDKNYYINKMIILSKNMKYVPESPEKVKSTIKSMDNCLRKIKTLDPNFDTFVFDDYRFQINDILRMLKKQKLKENEELLKIRIFLFILMIVSIIIAIKLGN